MKYLILSLILLSSCAISKTKLSSDGKAVKVLLSKSKTCDVLDKVVGENEKGSEALAKNHARNLAGDLGANAIHFDEIVPNGSIVKIYATAYQCKN